MWMDREDGHHGDGDNTNKILRENVSEKLPLLSDLWSLRRMIEKKSTLSLSFYNLL